MNLYKDKYGLNCFKIKVNSLSDLIKQWGVEEIDYLASNYNDNFYMLHDNGVFGLIVVKENCSLIEEMEE